MCRNTISWHIVGILGANKSITEIFENAGPIGQDVCKQWSRSEVLAFSSKVVTRLHEMLIRIHATAVLSWIYGW